jgi:hypothetical protein
MTMERVITKSEATNTYLGVCEPCHRPVRVVEPSAGDRYTMLNCQECGRPIRAERLWAVTTKDRCDVRCMSAVGASCDCACAGWNHGAHWTPGTPSQVAESALESYRAQVAKREAAAEKRRASKLARERAAFDVWAGEHRELVTFLAAYRDGSTFLFDMRLLVARSKPLTPRQTDAAERAMGAEVERAEQAAADLAAARPVPEGSVRIDGVVVWTGVAENPFGPGHTAKMIVKGGGWKVLATVPADVRRGVRQLSELRGRGIRCVAEVTASRDDVSFGYAKRLKGVEITVPVAV